MTKQIGNIVGGDQAGRDINKTINVYPHSKPALSILIKKYEQEKADDVIFTSMVEKLQHFVANIDAKDDEFSGLEEKLTDGKYDAYLEYAKRAKESFAKRLTKLQLYESAQKILAFLLADILTRYHNTVYPLIEKGSTQEEVLKAVQDEIVDPIHMMFEECFISLELYKDEVNGALYFLTGNCHIKWR